MKLSIHFFLLISAVPDSTVITAGHKLPLPQLIWKNRFQINDDRNSNYSCLRKIFCAERCAPVSSSNPDKNAQNIMLTEIANGP